MTYALISCFTPGPSNILCMTYAGKYGVRRTVNFIIGLSIGFALLLAVCGIASSALFDLLSRSVCALGFYGRRAAKADEGARRASHLIMALLLAGCAVSTVIY